MCPIEPIHTRYYSIYVRHEEYMYQIQRIRDIRYNIYVSN